MDAHNALSIDPTKFGAAAISEDTQAFNKKLMEMMSTGPRWYEVSRPAAPFFSLPIPYLYPFRSAPKNTARCVLLAKRLSLKQSSSTQPRTSPYHPATQVGPSPLASYARRTTNPSAPSSCTSTAEAGSCRTKSPRTPCSRISPIGRGP